MTSTPATTARTTFLPEDFTRLRGGHGATKLSTSAVSPLVAAARGYETVYPDDVREVLARHNLGAVTSRNGRKVKEFAGTGDVMLMPWFRFDTTTAAAASGRTATADDLQLRPVAPRAGQGKYDGFEGVQKVLDLHPATPASWVKTASRIVMAEGLAKGDSALTGILRAAGVEDDVLADDTVADPRAHLREVMESIAPDARVLVVSFAGVANWRGRAEWSDIPVNGSTVWVAIDADASSNLAVWNQTHQLFEVLNGKKAKAVRLIDLGRLVPQAAQDKVGIDDFLGDYGRWEDIPRALADLPDSPLPKDAGVPGDWRVAPDGLSTEMCQATVDNSGKAGIPIWVPSGIDLGGRVESIVIPRTPSDQEIATGRIDPALNEGEAQVSIEVAWRDLVTEQIARSTITGPTSILSELPKDWERRGALVPWEVSRHPHWPPSDKQARPWVQAIKSHRIAETTFRPQWESMGWAPTESGLPEYNVGRQTITATGITVHEQGTVDERDLARASDFGVIAPPSGVDWHDDAREALQEVYDAYIAAGAWTNPGMAGVVIGTGLRPCLPIPNRLAAFLVGQRRSGKSWSAAAIMSFWQSRTGAWDGDRLPGSAKDTVAATEKAISQANIWVADDFAPSPDRNTAVREEEAMGDLIRRKHNNIPKRRMNADMSARRVFYPRSVLIVTAENAPTTSSVMDRAVVLHFRDGALHRDKAPLDQVAAVREVSGAASRLSGAMIRWYLERAEATSWTEVVAQVHEKFADAVDYAAQRISGDDGGKGTRHALMASEVTLALWELSQMATDLGMPAHVIAAFNRGGLVSSVADLVRAEYNNQATTAPGPRFLQALQALLASGKAFVGNAQDPSEPPQDETEREHHLINSRLGWETVGKDVRPASSASRVGWLVHAKAPEGSDRGVPVVLVDLAVAFPLAQRGYPELIPFGHRAASAAQSLWDSGLTMSEKDGWSRRSKGSTPLNTVRVRVGSEMLSGVPIPLDLLLDRAAATVTETVDQAA